MLDLTCKVRCILRTQKSEKGNAIRTVTEVAM